MEQELLFLPEHLSSPPVFSGVPVTRSLVLYVCFVDRYLSFCTFSFGHCVVCSSSIYRFWLPLWYLQLFLYCVYIQNLQSNLHTFTCIKRSTPVIENFIWIEPLKCSWLLLVMNIAEILLTWHCTAYNSFCLVLILFRFPCPSLIEHSSKF